MKYLVLLCIPLFLLGSCKKKEAELPKTGAKGIPVFPLRKGNVWEVTEKTFYLDGTVQDSVTYNDTIQSSIMVDGVEFFLFAGSSYHLVDNQVIEIAGDRSGNGQEQKYLHYRYSDAVDTLWKSTGYNQASGDAFYCVAYPYETIINNMKCRRTETRGYVFHELLPYISYKKLLYCALGYGPVFEQDFTSNGSQLYKTRERSFKPIAVSYE